MSLNIHTPSTPTLLVVARFLISSVPDPGREKVRPLEVNPAFACKSGISDLRVHCMSSYRKVTNES